MEKIAVTLTLSADTAQAAEAAGLFQEEALRKDTPPRPLSELMARLHAYEGRPSPEEIAAEIGA